MRSDKHLELVGRTGGRILRLLMDRDRTVSELGEELGLTANAVRVPLAKLERDGFIEQSGQREGTRRPHLLYRITPTAERLLPKAYVPVLTGLLSLIAERYGRAEVRNLVVDLGRRIAGAAGRTGAIASRVDLAKSLLDELGAVTEWSRDARGRHIIRGRACPLVEVVREHPEVCKAVESMLGEVLDAPVTERCERGDRPRCGFVVGDGGAPAE